MIAPSGLQSESEGGSSPGADPREPSEFVAALIEVEIENLCVWVGLTTTQTAAVLADHRRLESALLPDTIEILTKFAEAVRQEPEVAPGGDGPMGRRIEYVLLFYIQMLGQIRKYAQVIAQASEAHPAPQPS